MHPRNIFTKNRPDFIKYSITRPSLKPHLISVGSHCTLNFNDPQALRELTCATLQHEFNINIDIPAGHLVPTIPLRLNYIHWIEDLLTFGNNEHPKGSHVVGVDIGCGPVCIYPLLGARLNGWSFIGTEIQEESVRYAKNNVTRNNYDDKIKVIQVTSDVMLKEVIDTPPHDTVNYSFCMCNPPFYGHQSEMSSSSSGQRPIPLTTNTGNEYETVTTGGEVEFVKRIIKDSLIIGNRIKWYTSMLGKKDSLKEIKTFLKESNIDVVMETTFVQGKTRRWGVAWSFDSAYKRHLIKETRKQSQTYTVQLTSAINTKSQASVWIKDTLNSLKIQFNEDSPGNYHCTSDTNTWSKQRKRKRLIKRIEEAKKSNADNVDDLLKELSSLDTPCRMEFKCLINASEGNDEIKTESTTEQGPSTKRFCADKEESNDPLTTCTREPIKTETTGERCTDVKDPLYKPAKTVPVKEKEIKLKFIFEWISGDGTKDDLHQFVQLIKNLLTEISN